MDKKPYFAILKKVFIEWLQKNHHGFLKSFDENMMFRKQTMVGKEVNETIESLSHLFFEKNQPGNYSPVFQNETIAKKIHT